MKKVNIRNKKNIVKTQNQEIENYIKPNEEEKEKEQQGDQALNVDMFMNSNSLMVYQGGMPGQNPQMGGMGMNNMNMGGMNNMNMGGMNNMGMGGMNNMGGMGGFH